MKMAVPEQDDISTLVKSVKCDDGDDRDDIYGSGRGIKNTVTTDTIVTV